MKTIAEINNAAFNIYDEFTSSENAILATIYLEGQ